MHGGDGAPVVTLICAVTNLPLGKEAVVGLSKKEEEEREKVEERGGEVTGVLHCPAEALRKGLALDWTTPVGK